jgi:carbonic anhydrase
MCLQCPPDQSLSRRRLLGAGAAFAALAGLGASAATARAAGKPGAAEPAPAANAISPDEALRRLMDGNARYAANAPDNKDFSAGRAARASAQFPIAAIVSCADARVAPELLFDQAPGELFVIRVAGNFVNTDGLASLEYGVKFLGVPLVMVLGHSGCGAIDATIKVIRDRAKLPGHLPQLINALKPGVETAMKASPQDVLAAATTGNVRANVQRLAAAQPILAPLVGGGKVRVVGGVYDIGSGRVAMV